MVRETRHLWVGNLPENIREDRIREHFKRYGRVQSVKLLPRGEECPVDGGSNTSLSEGNEGGSGSSSGGGSGSGGGGSSTSGGASATVAFMDIKSAAKAHATEHTLEERALTTQYYEPQHLQHRFPSHTSSEDHGAGGGSGGGNGGTGSVSGGNGNGSGNTGAGVGGSSGSDRGDRGSEGFDIRGSHGSFYGSERSNRVVGTGSVGGVGGGGGSSASGVGVSGHPADPSTGDPGGYMSRNRPPPAGSYHVTSSRARDRLYPRSGPYVSGPPPPPHLDRHRGSLPPSPWYEPTRYGGVPPPPSPATNDTYQDEQGGGGGSNSGALRQHKKQRRKSRSGSSSPSGSSRSGSSSSSRSGSSGASTSGGSTSAGSSPHRTGNAAITDDRRPLAICVRNLPTRSSDTSLKDGLFHEYKKHGKVTWVKVVGAAGDRYALVCFKKPEDVEKALEVSQDKLFFGCKIEVAPYQGYDVDDNEFRPYEAELDEYHPKATRTLFIGNLEKDVTASELRKHFEPFGEIIEIDIKKQGAVSSYAFCQYSDIGSVVKAMRSMDGEHLGTNRIKLGFGKSMPTPCVWVDGIGDCMSEKYLNMQFHQFGPITQVVVDRERGHALVFFDQISCAQTAVKEMRGTALRGRRLQVDFASRECQDTFYEHLERQGNSNEKSWDSRPSPASSFDVARERTSFDSAVTVSSSSSRFTRYDTPPRSRTASYSRTSGGSTPGASPAHPTAMSRSSRRSYPDSYYDGDYSEPASRRFRSYDEFSQGSGASHDDYQSSVLSDGKLNDDDCPPPSRRHAVQSVVTSVDPPAPPPPLLPPPDIRHLQKERVHLLEQLEECHSSGDEVGFVPKKRAKHDSSSTTILCEDDEPEIASLLVTSHPNRKGMDFRRVSDNKVVVHHSTRRGSCESSRGPGPCKRRRDATSRHHEHHDGSRPGTPLVDERPENLLVPSEPRRFRERSHEGPLSLPLPRFAAQMLNNNNNNNNNNTSSSNNNNGSNTRSSNANLAKVASPPANLSTAPSPRTAPQPPASPPPRHTSSSPASSDSETAPQSPSLEERIRSLDEKYEKWSGSRALSAAGGDALAKLDASASERFRFRHKLLDLDLHEVQPSDIVKSVLAKRSVFDEDSKRLENFSEKYEPREFTGVIGVSSMIGSTAGLTATNSCTSKVCLQYPFPSHPPVQSTSGTSVTNQVGINTPLSANLTTTMVSALKTDPRMMQHNCVHPTPATPITPGTSIKTVSPELPPVSLPIGLGNGTAASSGNGSGLASVSSLLSSGSVSNIHNLGASTHRGLSISATASPVVTATSTDAFSTAITTAVPVTTSSTAMTTVSVTGALSSMTTTSSIAPSSSITSSSNSSCSSALSASSTDMSRSRLRKEISGGNRESRDSRDVKDRESKHSKGKDCQRRSRKDETDVERNRKDRDERESLNIANDVGSTDNHRDFKENREVKYERKEREEKEKRDKEDRDKQDRREKEDRDRQEKKERDERERREKDEERREKERLDKEKQEKDRKEREERERERKEREENELKEKERREKERIDRERKEREEKERQERKEREERERREREERERKDREIRLERERQEKERLRREREEQERREKEERDRLERERKREEKERLERERKREREEKERLERERRKEKEEREKIEKEKREKEERERLEREKHEREKRREREDQERREKEKTEREKRRDRDEKDKEKRERDDSRRQSTENHLHSSNTQSQNQIIPTPVPIKRRCSSLDGPTDEDIKRMKISDHRRDSKDRSRQNRRSEDRKHRNDSHRSSRESRENREKESSNVTQDSRDTHNESTRETNSRDSGKEKQRSKRNRSEKESRERSPRVSHEPDKEFLSKLELSKKNDSSSLSEQVSVASNHMRDTHHQQQQSALNSHSDVDDGPLTNHEIQAARIPSATDTDSDEPKKHSIFDIVDDEPAYISMYDKVKARSTKNMQKLEEEKRQVRLKDKFSQLKQSRARREEKKQSTSWDGDSVSSKALTEDEATSESDSTRTKSLSRKGSRSRIHSDTSEEEEVFNNKIRKPAKAERFVESDVDLGFADTEDKQNTLEASNVIVNNVHTNIKEEGRTSDEDERMSVSFRANHPAIVNNHDRDPRKKSHKKKQKRQKNSVSNEDAVKVEPTETLEHKNKTNVVTSNMECRPNHSTESRAESIIAAVTTVAATPLLENAEERMRADKKQRNKKDKRRDRNGEDKAKARRKRLNRQEARDSQRMEDIFGPLSDDIDDSPSNTFFNRFGNMTSENSAYASDSDGGRSSLDMDRIRRKTEKKRRHQQEDENSVDLAEAGREIEAKLLDMPNSPKATPVSTEPSDHDVFRFTDDNDSVEPSTPSTVPEKIKEKKKKRKKSKEERSRKDYHHHHHHHHHHHEKSGELPYLGAEPSPPRASSPVVSKTISPGLPTSRELLLSPIPKVTNVSTVSSITPPVVSGSIQTSKSEKKKDKFIPGFGIEIDETIHENAVKSISEPDERGNSCQSRNSREEPEVSVPTTPPTQNEDKPRVSISQEETEDAVAALLEETFGASTEDFSYEGEEEEDGGEADEVAETPTETPQEDVEEMQQAVDSLNASTGEGDADLKPDTPQSEHDLQIDTDTEEDPNYETVDLTQPPKTPDIPSFYKSPTKTLNMTSVLTAPEKSVEVRVPTTVTKPQSPPSSVIHSWNLNEHNKPHESVKQPETTSESDADITNSERIMQVQKESASPSSPQYKQPVLTPCSIPITSEIQKSLSVANTRPSSITPLYQRLSVSPQSQMVPLRQASPKMQNVTTVSCSSSSNTTPLPPLVSSRIPPLVPSQQLSPRVSQPLSPNGQWSRNPTMNPHPPSMGKRKASPPPTKIAVCVPIPAHRPETPVQQIYSTAATQQPVIQHASGMLAPAPCYPRGGLPPLTLNIPPRPYMPVPPLASGIQVKNSRDTSLGGKSVIETLLPVNPNEPSQRLEEPKLSPAVIPEPTNKASTSPKVPSPNQPPTYIPETAKIEINASTSNQVFNKPAYITDSYALASRTQKHISVSITTDNNLLSPRQKQEMSNVQLLTTHVRSSTSSPVIVAHCQSHLIHKPVHTLGSPAVSSSNQPLIKTVVPVVPQQITPSTASPMPSDNKCVISQTSLACQKHSSVSQSQLIKSHVPLVSTVSQTIITRVVPSTVSSISAPSMNEQTTPECLEQHIIQEQQMKLDTEVHIGQTAQPMQLTPPIQPTQPIDEIKQESIDVKQENTMDEIKYNIVESEKSLNQEPCVEDDVKLKQEKEEVIKTEIAPCIIPKTEAADAIVPKLETEISVKLEPMNEVKEEDVAKDNDEVELDEEPVEDPLKEPSTDPLAIDVKEDPTDNKEDSDYWSAKEVNIESVIKKVDALCDGEGNDGENNETQQTENTNNDSHDTSTSKNESDWFDDSIESENKKNFVSTDDHDESIELCENESTKSRRGRTKSRRGSRGGVTTRRGRNANTVSHRRGGRSSRGSKHHVEKNKLPADVYEFHDDSEEDNAGRPRLILTIKSPGPNVTGLNAQPATPVAAIKEVPPEEFVFPTTNTRKSRRLAERDGNRNTVDDVIEDVVRGSPANKGLAGNAGNVHATRRSTRHNNIPRNVSSTQQSVVPLTELRKSTRGNRKAARRISENNDDSGEEKMKEAIVIPQEVTNKEEPKLTQPESPKAEEPPIQIASAPQKTVSLEPMTLIDPVTGMLIPMTESEEGQYVPVSTSSGQVQTTNRILCESRSGGLINVNSANGEASRTKSITENSLLVLAEPKKEPIIEQTSSQPAPIQQIQPQTSVITKPQSPVIQATSTITIAQSSTTGTTITATATTTPIIATTQTVPTSSTQTKPTSLKAHVLNASKLVTSAQQQVIITKSVASSLPNQTIVQNIIKPSAQAIQGGLNLQIPSGRVVSPSLSPRAKQTAQLVPSSGKQGQPMSPVLNNTGVPPNPKQHLLQAAAKQQPSTIVNMSQKVPMNAHSASVNITTPRIHQSVSQPTALKGQPHPLNPKTHLLQAVVPPIVTGTVASSSTQSHLVNPQPISTGVSNVRPPGPKTPAPGTMEPQKVEVPMSGCIMVPTASPQTRSVPMPTYEAPLHGSTGAAPPGGQYGLVPPHRSQSPPLPPPAHHHVNTSQSEVVNHYGGLTRGGELPPHYLHPQMLQYQYLRAQQEALTAPRIAYHIPGTRSPHLPLDPKLDTNIEDSHSPPLELRRGTRTPQDRTTDSPQVAQVYMLHSGVRLPPPPPQYNAGSNPSLPGTPAGTRTSYYEPPPAHLRSQYPIAASEAPPEMGRATTPERCRKHQVVTPPPYASQVPPQADTFQMLLQRYPVMWQGLLALKNDQAAVQMHFVFGNPNVARDSLPCNSDGSTPPLRIAQRMRLEPTQVEGVARKMQTDNEHCMLLALPCGRDEVDVLQQSKNLQTGFIMYLQQKQAAGIVNIAAPGSQQPAYVVHIFPSCDFAHENLARIAPDLHHRVAKIAHLLIVIATV